MKTKTIPPMRFKRLCMRVADDFDIEPLYFWPRNRAPAGDHQDDGNLHVIEGSVRASFGIGQDWHPKLFNEMVRQILTGLGRSVPADALMQEEVE